MKQPLSRSARIVACALFALAICVPMMVYPRYLDDLWYGIFASDYLRGLTDSVDTAALRDTLLHHWSTDNMRLCNTVFTFMLLLPKWIGGALGGLAIFASLILTGRIAGCRIGSMPAPLLGLLLCLWSFCLPWYDCMTAECFQFNYIISTALALYVALVYLRRPYRRTWVYAALGLLCGLWHEGFAAPLAGAMTLIAVGRPAERSRRRTALICGLFAGLLWLALCPAATGRALPLAEIFRPGHMAFVTFVHPAMLIMLLLMSIVAWKRRSYFRGNLFVLFFLLMTLISFCIHMYGPRTPRTGFWAEVCSIVLCIGVLHHFYDLLPRFFRSRVAAGIAFVLVGVHLAASLRYTFTVSDFEADIEASRQAPDGVIFRDFVTEHDAPVAAWQYPDLTLYLSENRDYVPEFYDFEPGKEFIVIPTVLEYVTADSGRQLSPDSPVRELGGRLFMPTDSLRSGEFDATVTFGPLRTRKRIFYYPFTSRADGRRYAYLYPWRSVVEMWLWNVDKVEEIIN
ncbi:MAG: DUF6056 family protein [Muribaculaceae bacterium]|nr:DUF6056 family protein [Muribaculaceae bacterium]